MVVSMDVVVSDVIVFGQRCVFVVVVVVVVLGSMRGGGRGRFEGEGEIAE